MSQRCEAKPARAVGLSRFGVAARAIVFALLGWGIVVAGWFRGV